ncbi:uncharacterized protein LOC105383837 [Plutella xylostella]|uniref:uncharacterized protein LOC105383837 n=1 Tax=Plutella xylostella TaxID=51655 RepID=UPI002032389E|nr:uncharacterized protein LOC105383837 [Plutella xylostella]
MSFPPHGPPYHLSGDDKSNPPPYGYPAYPGYPAYGYPPVPGHHQPPGHYPPPMYLPMMMPVPIHYPQPDSTGNPTYVTNYIYHGETHAGPDSPAVADQVQVAECSGDLDWVPTTSTLAGSLTGRAVVAGHEGWDGSPLWVMRARHCGQLIPGKLNVRHNSATITHNGREVPVQNIEVLCSKGLRWVPATNGNVPPFAIPGGHTSTGEQLFIGRARYQLSLTPGKVQASRNGCLIPFGGSEVVTTMYDVLCRAS